MSFYSSPLSWPYKVVRSNCYILFRTYCSSPDPENSENSDESESEDEPESDILGVYPADSNESDKQWSQFENVDTRSMNYGFVCIKQLWWRHTPGQLKKYLVFSSHQSNQVLSFYANYTSN